MASPRINIKLRKQKIIIFFDSGIKINLIDKKHVQVFSLPYTVDNHLRLININNYITIMLDICESEEIFINPVRIK